MRALLKIALGVLAVCALVVVFGLSWFFFYSSDLPDLSAISQFAPQTSTKVSDPCLKSPSIAISDDGIGDNLRAALTVAEAGEDGPTAIEETSRAFSDVRGHPALAFQISRTMFCSPTKTGSRDLKQLRVAAQLERHFTRRELFTIAANRYYFGADLIGVQGAAQHFFHKIPSQLTVGEAARLAGLVRAPSYFSPDQHPDRAVRRRNQVIEAMVASHAITQAEAEDAIAIPLNIATN